MSAMSPMQRSLEKLRSDGFRIYITETNHRIGKLVFKKDLFGFCDILALKKDCIRAVQTTSRSNLNARVKKICDSPELEFVRMAGIEIIAEGWAYSKRTKTWVCTEVDLS